MVSTTVSNSTRRQQHLYALTLAEWLAPRYLLSSNAAIHGHLHQAEAFCDLNYRAIRVFPILTQPMAELGGAPRSYLALNIPFSFIAEHKADMQPESRQFCFSTLLVLKSHNMRCAPTST
jgi:hypothetical protein